MLFKRLSSMFNADSMMGFVDLITHFLHLFCSQNKVNTQLL